MSHLAAVITLDVFVRRWSASLLAIALPAFVASVIALAEASRLQEASLLLEEALRMFRAVIPFTRDNFRARESRKRPREWNDGAEHSQRFFKKQRRFLKPRRFSKRDDKSDKSRQGKREQGRGPSSNKNIECFNCGEMGHYANECPKPKKNSTKGGGRGGTKGGRGGRGGGRDMKSKSSANESNATA